MAENRKASSFSREVCGLIYGELSLYNMGFLMPLGPPALGPSHQFWRSKKVPLSTVLQRVLELSRGLPQVYPGTAKAHCRLLGSQQRHCILLLKWKWYDRGSWEQTTHSGIRILFQINLSFSDQHGSCNESDNQKKAWDNVTCKEQRSSFLPRKYGQKSFLLRS